MARITTKKLDFLPKLAIIVSQFNEEITNKLLEGALQRLHELGNQADVIQVPGAIEIPLMAQRAANAGQYDAIITLAAVIRGETDHYDYVCQQVSYGCQKVALNCNIPVIFGILTTENEEQALARVGGSQGHKGKDAVDCAYSMISLSRQFP
jgi:6,7-dimethyl-8-ribityllumazine synthase